MGHSGELVVSSSDEGSVFVWERATGKMLNLLKADDTAALCATPHPILPSLATAGVGATVRIWEPQVRLSAPAVALLQQDKHMLLPVPLGSAGRHAVRSRPAPVF